MVECSPAATTCPGPWGCHRQPNRDRRRWRDGASAAHTETCLETPVQTPGVPRLSGWLIPERTAITKGIGFGMDLGYGAAIRVGYDGTGKTGSIIPPGFYR